MSASRFDFIAVAGRVLAATVLGIGLAGLGLPASAEDAGTLRLQLGKTVEEDGLHFPSRFVYETPGTGDTNPEQFIFVATGTNCDYQTDAESGAELAVLTAGGGMGMVGFKNEHIGVINGDEVGSCYKISAKYAESLNFALGPYLLDDGVAGFDQLELDMDVKNDSVFKLEVFDDTSFTNAVDTYYLYSGKAVTTDLYNNLPPPPSRVFNCDKKKTCRWTVTASGQAFRLTAQAGEGSLGGGGDFKSKAYDNNTIVHLVSEPPTEVSGTLGCGDSTPTVGDGVNTPQCTVTLASNFSVENEPSCSAVEYQLNSSDDGDEAACDFNASGNASQQLAGSVEITFPPTEVDYVDVSEGEYVLNLPRTVVTFILEEEEDVPFEPQLCRGTIVTDENGNPTIEEVLNAQVWNDSNDGEPCQGNADATDGCYDVGFGNDTHEWACILEEHITYVGEQVLSYDCEGPCDPEPSAQVRQKILWWGFGGDPRFSRD